MDTNIWYEEELLPPAELIEQTSKSLQQVDLETLAQELGISKSALVGDKNKAVDEITREKAKGILRVHRPRARQITSAEAGELAGDASSLFAPGKLAKGPLFLVRLGMEFDVAFDVRSAGWGYRTAWCRARLFAARGATPPRLLDIFPQRLYEGQPHVVQVKAEPSLKVENVMETSLGSIGTDFRFGQVSPVTLGFLGDEERNPYWQLQEKEKPILGLYHFWLLLEQPPGCEEVGLEMYGEGDLRTKLFMLPVGPKVRKWGRHQPVHLAEILV